MEGLVSVINKLQEIFTITSSDALQLPQIIVVGDQSSGKSSVLECIVGKSFLPRGTGIVTRCPLILQIVRKEDCVNQEITDKELTEAEEWGVFLHDQSTIYVDFNEVRKEILAETERRAGPNKGICSEPIVLKISSPKVHSLTIIDLPGIVKVPVGDQPHDIEATVKELILQYIMNPNSIILAVVTANTDMATCESLKLARQVDPTGSRTLAVVTKIDLMDAGTDALEILTGKVIPVKLGIIGVVNRSQKDIQEGRSIEESLVNEASFFRKYYSSIAPYHGSTFLAKTLHVLLLNHIQDCLPDLKQRVNSSINHYHDVLKTIGKRIEDPNEYALEVLTKFASTYCSKILGDSKEIETCEISGGARINYIFHKTFGSVLDSVNPLGGFNRTAILTAIENTSGTRPSVFVPEACFELLIKKQIPKLEMPSVRCVQLVEEEMESIIHNCGTEVNMIMQRFPKLYKKIVEVTTGLIKARIPVTIDMVKKLVAIQNSYIDTSHPDFMSESSKWSRLAFDGSSGGRVDKTPIMGVPMALSSPSFNHSEELQEEMANKCFLIENLVISYFNIIKKTIKDCVPKAIMHFLVNHVMEHLLSELVKHLYIPGSVKDALEESEDIVKMRDYARRMLESLEQAKRAIYEIKDALV